MSLADFTIIIFSALSTVTCVPGWKPIFDGDCEAAIGDTVSSVSSVQAAFLDRLQRDIGRHQLGHRGRIPGIVAFSACSTLPVSASTTSSASACAARGVATASAATSEDQVQQ